MKTETLTRFIAFDGTPFDKEDDCLRHEKSNVASRLVGLTIEEVLAAQTRENKELGDAIEAVAGKIKRARIEQGDLKRQGRPKNGAAPAPGNGAQQQNGTEHVS